MQNTQIVCWKCSGTGIKPCKKKDTVEICPVCMAAKYLFPVEKPPGNPHRPFKKSTDPVPGPAAAFDMLHPEMNPNPGEILTSLSGNWMIYQLEHGHRMTSDDIFGAACAFNSIASSPNSKITFMDLGTGLGSVLNMVNWCLKTSGKQFKSIGIEAQIIHVNLAKRTLKINGCLEDSEIIHKDIRDVIEFHQQDYIAGFDLITGTPPYFKQHTGCLPRNYGRAMCAFEIRGGIEDYLKTASLHLRKTKESRFIVVNTSLETRRTIDAAGRVGFKCAEVWNVKGKVGKPDLFSVFVFKWVQQSDCADTLVTKTFSIRGEDGQYTDEVKEIFKVVGIPTPTFEPFTVPRSFKDAQ